MDRPFWKHMIATCAKAHDARSRFGDPEPSLEPSDRRAVWSFNRRGRTRTELPNSRIVYIGGHSEEDCDDYDFNIYNDVIVLEPPNPISLRRSGQPWNRPHSHMNELPPLEDTDGITAECIQIYGYHRNIFPPIDYHTATYLYQTDDKQYIYIIGGRGVVGQTSRDETHVYRLDLSDFSIEHLDTYGRKPPTGIWKHWAELLEDKNNTSRVLTRITTTNGNGVVLVLILDTLQWYWGRWTNSQGELTGPFA